jgi:hypothetical protein
LKKIEDETAACQIEHFKQLGAKVVIFLLKKGEEKINKN